MALASPILHDVDIDFVTVRVLDLQLGENVFRPPCSRRCPRETQHVMIVSTSECPEVRPGDDYMLVGVHIGKSKGTMPTIFH